MFGDQFWHCLHAVAAQLDGEERNNGRVIQELLEKLLDMPRERQHKIRRQMRLVIAELSRLELRARELDEPS